jgi:hypothetical protein
VFEWACLEEISPEQVRKRIEDSEKQVQEDKGLLERLMNMVSPWNLLPANLLTGATPEATERLVGGNSNWRKVRFLVTKIDEMYSKAHAKGGPGLQQADITVSTHSLTPSFLPFHSMSCAGYQPCSSMKKNIKYKL